MITNCVYFHVTEFEQNKNFFEILFWILANINTYFNYLVDDLDSLNIYFIIWISNLTFAYYSLIWRVNKYEVDTYLVVQIWDFSFCFYTLGICSANNWYMAVVIY